MPVDDSDIRLDVRNLTLSWDGRPVVRDISFQVHKGEVVCLLGRSGAGKSTIFHAVAGLTQPDSGCVLLDGEDITGKPGKVGYMLQKDLLLEQHTVIDNVCMPLVIGGRPRARAREEAGGQFAAFGLQGCERRYPFQLSGGMRQRAALLRTHLMGCDMVLMDEPFSALDAFTRVELRTWFLRMSTRLGYSLLLVTHDVDEAIALADRILVLSGSYADGQPGTIAGSVAVDCPRADREGFLLTDAALSLKRQVLALI